LRPPLLVVAAARIGSCRNAWGGAEYMDSLQVTDRVAGGGQMVLAGRVDKRLVARCPRRGGRLGIGVDRGSVRPGWALGDLGW
jgi:hypothetical protein